MSGPATHPASAAVASEPVACDALSYLEVNAARTPDALAVWEGGRATSFAALRVAVGRATRWLARRGLGDGAVVAVALPNVTAYVALEIAVPAAGAVLFPLPMGIGERELAGVLARSGARLLVGDDSERGTDIARIATGLPEPVATALAAELTEADRDGAGAEPDGAGADRDRAGADRDRAVTADPDRIVQIALTSGTTGMPKLASLSARLKQLTFEGFTTRLRIGPDDRMFPMSPITQGVGEMCLYALRRGAALVMLGDRRFDPDAVLRIAAASEARILGGVPTMVSRLLHAGRDASADAAHRALPRLRLTVSAGAPLDPAVARDWERVTGSPVGSFYGAMDIGQLAVPDPADPPDTRWTTVGRPHATAQWRICAPDGAPLPPGETGEIAMRGPLVQDSYWGEDATPYGDDGWARFGDLGFVDDDGYLHVTGRAKDTIIRGGNNINPREVEELVREHPLVRDVCVVGRPDADLGERAVAFLVTAPGDELGVEALAAFLEQRGLSRYKWPETVERLDALPTGATGKVDRIALRARAEALA